MPPRSAQSAKPKTPDLIVEAAERLFGRHGLDAVSLRQIAAATGSSNHFAVQYYFGDKATLVRAIFERRLPLLETRRAELLAEVQAAGRMGDVRALIEVMLRPMAEVRDADGRRSYAAFMLALRTARELQNSRTEATELAPLTKHIFSLLGQLTDLPEGLFRRRVLAASTLFLHVVADLDDQDRPAPLLPEEQAICEALDMAAAMLMAPVTPSVRQAAEGGQG